MAHVTVLELRNRSGAIIRRVAAIETMTVTRDGEAIAKPRPLLRRPLAARIVLQRWRRLPSVDPVQWRDDIDNVMAATL